MLSGGRRGVSISVRSGLAAAAARAATVAGVVAEGGPR